jgi:N-acetyl-gamma-glutamyl-phosphate reductase
MISKTCALSLFLCIASTNPISAFAPSRSFASKRLGSELDAKKKIFIDGEAGTTGLQVRDRLAGRDDLEIISIADDLRKDAGERKRLINEADCVILCKCTATFLSG